MKFANLIPLILLVISQVGALASTPSLLAENPVQVTCSSRIILLSEFSKQYSGGKIDPATIATLPYLSETVWHFIFQMPNIARATYKTEINGKIITSGSLGPDSSPINGGQGIPPGQFLSVVRAHNEIGALQYQNLVLGLPMSSLLANFNVTAEGFGASTLQLEKPELMFKKVVVTNLNESEVLFVATIVSNKPDFKAVEDGLRSTLKSKGFKDTDIEIKVKELQHRLQDNAAITAMIQRLESAPPVVQFDSYTYTSK
jgi:hypothetical protein